MRNRGAHRLYANLVGRCRYLWETTYGIFGSINGTRKRTGATAANVGRKSCSGSQTSLSDEQADAARYRYMLQTAPPETIEQAHEEAFAKLTPEQRRIALRQLRATLPEHEQAAGARSQADPKTLAQMATQAASVSRASCSRRLVAWAA